MSSQEQQQTERQAAITHDRDAAVARMDQEQVKERMLETFDLFVQRGFETHLVGERERGAIMYRLELKADGVGATSIRELTAIADQHRLDVFVDKVEDDKLGIVAYARS